MSSLPDVFLYHDYRAFLGYCAYAGLTPTLFPAAVLAQIRSGTTAIDIATIRQAGRLAGLTWTRSRLRRFAARHRDILSGIEPINGDASEAHRLVGQSTR